MDRDDGIAASAPELPTGFTRYRTIVADPPWDIETVPTHLGGRRSLGRGGHTSTRLPYPSMEVDAICALPVRTLAANDCRMFLWTVNRYLPEAFRVLDAWGFRYRQTLVWHKTGTPSPFAAHIAPNHAEYLLIGVIGRPTRTGTLQSSVFAVPSAQGGGGRPHSTKPEVFLDEIERISPGPYLEMFSRRARFGWDTWGDQALHGMEAMTA